MSLGAIDFGLIVDGAVIIVENCLRRLGRAAARARAARSRSPERLDEVVLDASRQVRPADGLRRGDHHHRLPADPRAHRHRGEDVPADGADGDLRARRRVRPVADVRPGDGRAAASAAGCSEKENVLIRWAKRALRAGRCAGRVRAALARSSRGRGVPSSASLLLFARARAGVRARRSTSRTSRCTRCASRARASRSRRRCSSRSSGRVSRVPRGRVRLLQDRHGRDGVRPDAAERLRHVHHPQAAATASGRDRRASSPKSTDAASARAIEASGAVERELPGQQLRVHAADPDALQRADRRRAQRRRGEGLRRRLRRDAARRPTQIAARAAAASRAPPTCKVEQTDGAAGDERRRSTATRSPATA